MKLIKSRSEDIRNTLGFNPLVVGAIYEIAPNRGIIQIDRISFNPLVVGAIYEI